ncbi:MAG: hypothetical protein ACYC9Y_12920 [Candidatus Methylomirabilia bacterium]
MSLPCKDVSGGPPVPDVDALMRGVRAGVADKLDRGVCRPADLEELRRLGTVERRNRELLARCDELQAEVRGLQTLLGREGSAEKPA